jgi:tRNA-modifying protein YgfZ
MQISAAFSSGLRADPSPRRGKRLMLPAMTQTQSPEGEAAPDRRVIAITGADRFSFLQGLVTVDMRRLAEGEGLVYGALLSPQGKYLADFFLCRMGELLLLDAAASQADGLVKRLTLYKLRADVGLAEAGLHVQRGLGPVPDDGFADPRHLSLGWRAYRATQGTPPAIDWTALRVAACIPETGIELIENDSYILECGFERMRGVDFRKGCYVGQEVTARMHNRTELRKGLAPVRVEGRAEPGTEITGPDGRSAGRLFSQSGGRGIAWLRFDRATGPLRAGDAVVMLEDDPAGD